MRTALLSTGNRRLAEASPHDDVWGIGLRANDSAASNPAAWRGQNLLGSILDLEVLYGLEEKCSVEF